jgi:hypothetical protein
MARQYQVITIFHFLKTRDKKRKTMSLPVTLTLPQQFEIHACDLLQ